MEISKRKFGQTATEYLIILAVVIIIALIVVGVLGGIPGIGGSSRSAAGSAYWSTAQIGITQYAFAQTGADSITVRNNLPSPIVVTDVRISSALADTSLASYTLFNNSGNATLYGNKTLQAGQTFTYKTGDVLGMPTVAGGISSVACTAGDTYSYYVQINYVDQQTGAGYTFNGAGTPIEGRCAT